MQMLNNLFQFVLHWYWVLPFITILFVCYEILLRNGNPTKSLAWIMVILFLPIVGIILYFFFGRQFSKERFLRHIDLSSRDMVMKKWKEMDELLDNDIQEVEQSIGGLSAVFTYLNNKRVAPPTFHNEVKVVINGEEKFPLFVEAIKNARHHIHLEYYIFDEDEIGNTIIELLINKSKEGVKVRLLVDNFGSPKLSKHKHLFENTSVQFAVFQPVYFGSLANSNYRTHRKILIVDGAVGFVGGINISDKYINSATDNSAKLYWRDTSVQIKGDAVNILQMLFWVNWKASSNEKYSPSREYFVDNRDIYPKGTVVSFGLTKPGDEVPSAMEVIILGILRARKSIRICTPYFIPTDQLLSAMYIAAGAGVKVELMIPYAGDSVFVQQATLSYLRHLAERGIHVYLYEKGFLHAKTITIDECVAYVGTVNLDQRSLFINFEITAVMYDRKACERLDKQFEEDKRSSILYNLEEWGKNPWYKKLFSSLCRLLAPLI